MFEAFKLGYAVGMGIIASALTGLIILGVWDWLGGIVTRLRVVWYYRNQDRRPPLWGLLIPQFSSWELTPE